MESTRAHTMLFSPAITPAGNIPRLGDIAMRLSPILPVGIAAELSQNPEPNVQVLGLFCLGTIALLGGIAAGVNWIANRDERLMRDVDRGMKRIHEGAVANQNKAKIELERVGRLKDQFKNSASPAGMAQLNRRESKAKNKLRENGG